MTMLSCQLVDDVCGFGCDGSFPHLLLVEAPLYTLVLAVLQRTAAVWGTVVQVRLYTLVLAVLQRMAADWWMLWVSLAVVAAALAYTRWRRYSTHFARQGIPFAQPLPFVGNMLDMALSRSSMPDIIVQLYKKYESLPYVGVFSFTQPLLMVRDPEVIRAVTVKDFDHFVDHVGFISSEKANPLTSRMLFALKGKEWHDMRSTLSPAFTSMKMKNMFVLMAEIGQQMVEYLSKETSKFQDTSSSKENIMPLEMKDFFTRLTNDIIATTAFGVKVDSLAEQDNIFYQMGRDLTTFRPAVAMGYLICPKLMELLGVPFFSARTEKFFREMISKTMKTREEEGIVRHDMIHLMMEARRGELEAQNGVQKGVQNGVQNGVQKGLQNGVQNGAGEDKRYRLTEEDIVAQAMIFFFGGFDTVSTLMTFCSYLLATHPEVQRRLQQEVDDLMEKSGGKPSYEQLLGAQYLDMVVSETLRMYTPAAALDRKCVRAYRLPGTDSCPGFELQPGDAIWVPVHGIHHDPKYYQDPERFEPERFSPENKHLIQPFTYFPFGSGPRVCIAQRFALMESKVVLLFLMSRFSLHVVPQTPIPLKINPKNLSLSIKGGAWVGIKSRS